MFEKINAWADTCDVFVTRTDDGALTIANCVGSQKPDLPMEWVEEDAGILVKNEEGEKIAVAAWREAGAWRLFYLEYREE